MQRILGIVSFFILARILGPDDFGIVAMSFIVLGFFRAVTETGPQQYVLSFQEITDEILHTAWTLNFLTRFIVSLLLIVSAPFVSAGFNEPRLEMVLYVVSILPVINGLQSAGQFIKQRNFDYTAIALSQIGAKVTSFTIALFIAYKYETYWALIIGDLVFASMFSLSTYFFHSYRPKICMIGIREQWEFSKWILLKSIVGFIRSKADQFIASTFYDTRIVGQYNVSKELTLMPYNQIAEPLGPVIISGLANFKDNPAKLTDTYSKFFVAIFTVMLPVSVGFFLLTEEIIHFLLGDKWKEAATIVTYFAPLILTMAISQLSNTALTALHKVKLVFYLDLLTMIVFSVALYLARNLPVEQLAGTRTLLGFFIAVCFFIPVRSMITVSVRRILWGIQPSIIAVVVMSLAVLQIKAWLAGTWLLAVGVLTGMLVYAGVMFFALQMLRKVNPDARFLYDNSVWILNKLISKKAAKKPTP